MVAMAVKAMYIVVEFLDAIWILIPSIIYLLITSVNFNFLIWALFYP
jgi:hypothetical protein